MDVKYVNPILESMISTLGKMAKLEAKPGKPKIKSDELSLGDITGMMRMDGKSIAGSIALSFSVSVIIELVKRMLHQDITSIDDTAKDLAGELSNIVTGTSKTKLSELGYDINMSLPKILDGKGTPIDHQINAPVILLPFETEVGSVYVEMCFKM